MTLRLATALTAAAVLIGTCVSAEQAWVGSSSLNARSGPGTHYGKIGSFAPCAAITVHGYSDGWAKVGWNSGYGWVSARYLQAHACTAPAYKPKPQYSKPAPKPKGYGY